MMTPQQRNLARHALGLTERRRKSYRNRFAASCGSPDWWRWRMMEKKGLANRQQYGLADEMDMFWLTYSGAVAVLNPRETLDEEDFPDAAQIRREKKVLRASTVQKADRRCGSGLSST